MSDPEDQDHPSLLNYAAQNLRRPPSFDEVTASTPKSQDNLANMGNIFDQMVKQENGRFVY